MLNNNQQVEKQEIESILGATFEVLKSIMDQVERSVEFKEWTTAHNYLVDMAHGLKMFHGALDRLSDYEIQERNVQN